MASSNQNSQQFPFPNAESKVLPDPSKFLSPHLLSSPVPTHSFFQSFIVGNGADFIHPYMVKLASSSLSLSCPSLSATPSSISQNFTQDFTISTSQQSRHFVSSFSDLTVTVDFLASDLRFILARGCPYITVDVSRPLCLTFSCKSAIKSLSSSSSNTKHKIELENHQTLVLYSPSELVLKKDGNNKLNSKSFSGIIRVAIMPNNDSKTEEILDLYKSCYAINGEAVFSSPFSLDYKWETEGWGELLMLAHPLHLNLLYNSGVRVLNKFKYKSIDGDLVGVIGSFWTLRAPYVPITFHSFRGIPEQFHPEIVTALLKDVGRLDSTAISTTHCLYYGQKMFRAARLAVIAEEVNYKDVIPAIRDFLRDTLNPWLNCKFEGNVFFYEGKWGGIVTKQGLIDKSADYWFGLYHSHHNYLGYYIYAIAVLVKIDPDWGTEFKSQAYALVGSYMSLGKKDNSKYSRLRCFDFYKLHSWAKCLSNDYSKGESYNEDPSQSIAAYYSASLLGMVYRDDQLQGIGSTLMSFEIEAVKTWFHINAGSVYGEKFTKNNSKLVGIVLMNRREDKLTFTSSDHKEIRVGIQVMSLLPVLEILFSDTGFVREVVEWAGPALLRKEASDDWKAFVYALETLYDKDDVAKKIKKLKGFHETNCLTNMLWWLHSRGSRENFCSFSGKEAADCWFCAYCG